MVGVSLLDEAGREAAGVFLTRCLRLDPGAVVRLRPAAPRRVPGAAGPGRDPGGAGASAPGDGVPGDGVPGDGAPGGGAEDAGLWVRLPFGVLVSLRVRAARGLDATVFAGDLLGALSAPIVVLPERREHSWRWSLPPDQGVEVDRLLAADVRRVSAVAAATLRTAVASGVGGRSVGDRALRDGLLDHVPFVVTTEAGDLVPVSQRLVQAVMRAGFVADGDDTPVGVRVVGRWVGLATAHGAAWHRPSAVTAPR